MNLAAIKADRFNIGRYLVFLFDCVEAAAHEWEMKNVEAETQTSKLTC